MKRLDEYGKRYPYLVWDIWMFFEVDSTESLFADTLKKCGWGVNIKCSLDFIMKMNYEIQSETVSKICNKLCEKGCMSKVLVKGFNDIDESVGFYITALQKPKDELIKDKDMLSRHLNNLVFGFWFFIHL